MLLMGLLIQKMGRTQNPVNTYHKMVPSHTSDPDSLGSPTAPEDTVRSKSVELVYLNVTFIDRYKI